MVWFRLGQLDFCVKLHQSIARIVNPLLFEPDKIFVNPLFQCLYVFFCYCHQDGITCGAIKEASRSSKAIDQCVIIDFCDKNTVIAPFRDEMMFLTFFGLNFLICHEMYDKNVIVLFCQQPFFSINCHSFLFYRKPFYSTNGHYVLSIAYVQGLGYQ